MKSVPVAPPAATLGRAASLLEFYRQGMEKLALLRLTERDPDLLECIERAYGELLAGGAIMARKMRSVGLLHEDRKTVGLHAVDNPVHNPKTPGSR